MKIRSKFILRKINEILNETLKEVLDEDVDLKLNLTKLETKFLFRKNIKINLSLGCEMNKKDLYRLIKES